MIGIDTNVLVRYFAKDDPIQTPAAVQLLRSLTPEEPGWVSLTVVAELAWTLRRVFKMSRDTIVAVLDTLLRSNDIVVEQREVVYAAIELYSNGRADFADCLIGVTAELAGCSRTVTFDQIAARDAGMELLA